MPMRKGQWHRVDGVMKRRRGSYNRRSKTKLTLHEAQLVDHVETLPTAYADILPLDDHGKDALKAILDNVWHGMTLEEKIAMLDPRDPSNPEGL